jgi:molybdopterin-containing oxidoreductase family membrane subunit
VDTKKAFTGFEVVAPVETHKSVTENISDMVLNPTIRKGWLLGLTISSMLLGLFLFSLTYLVAKGVGIWGINHPVMWGFDIINFVWWIGIGHAGTLISAILLLLNQDWRNSINRFAEAMTLFAVACAGIYPIFHMGRPWLAYWLLPYPNTMSMWPQFRSPLMWDVFAISTYATVSLLFWFVGMVPDLATLRDRAKSNLVKRIYGSLAMGWRGSARHWERYETLYLILAGLSTPLVLSVHSIVSFDFSASVLPGWHSTIFPPYFVAGAIFAGFAMVLILMLPLRKIYHLENYITLKHLDNMAKVLMATGIMVSYGYLIEAFTGWYSGNFYERFSIMNKSTGPYAYLYWSLIFCNVVAPQVFWIPKLRLHVPTLFIVSLIVSVGMWLERYIIIVVSLHRDFLPSSWGMYAGTKFDWMLYLGTMGLFMTCIFLFIRILPSINMFEMKTLVEKKSGKEHH